MKSLYLLRHAESAWTSASGRDHDRPLSVAGRESASRIGRYLAHLDEVPDRVVTSTARRTRETLDLACRAGAWSPSIEPLDALYGGSADRVRDALRRHGGAAQKLLVVGHQPWIGDLVARLGDGGQGPIVTAALLRFDLQLDTWQALGSEGGELMWMVTPELLDNTGF